jgi:hypothetical protein
MTEQLNGPICLGSTATPQALRRSQNARVRIAWELLDRCRMTRRAYRPCRRTVSENRRVFTANPLPLFTRGVHTEAPVRKIIWTVGLRLAS